MSIQSASSSNVAASTWTTVAGWSLGSISGAMPQGYLSGISAGAVTMGVAGMYLVTAYVGLAAGTGNSRRQLRLTKNPGASQTVWNHDYSQGLQGPLRIMVTAFVPLIVGDVLAVQIYHANATAIALDPTSTGNHEWQMWRVGPDTAYSAPGVAWTPPTGA
jgi:hypothetical protein